MKILFVFHTPINDGYAMAPLEKTFYDVGSQLADQNDIYFAFSSTRGETSTVLPTSFSNYLEIDREKLKRDKLYSASLSHKLAMLKIDIALCFDMQPNSALNRTLRKGNIRYVASYWGAAMSSLNRGLKLLYKKAAILANSQRPDLFIFESEAMRRLAVNGRGIPAKETQVIPTGVDTHKWQPYESAQKLVRARFEIPDTRKIAIYSGHMEERKGVHVILEAAQHLHETGDLNAWHFLLCGDRGAEADRLLATVREPQVLNHITFGGYRGDLPDIMPGCDVGIIASTGWDSFPMSSLEMAACGLPILASDLQGLNEAVENGKTGFLFTPGDHIELAALMLKLGENPALRERLSISARQRIIAGYNLELHRTRLKDALLKVVNQGKHVA